MNHMALSFECKGSNMAEFCAGQRMTPPMLVAGTIGLLLGKSSRSEIGSFGLVSNGRVSGVENLVGPFAQIRPFVSDTADNPDLKEFAQRTRRAFIKSQDVHMRASRQFLRSTGIGQTRINIMSSPHSAKATENAAKSNVNNDTLVIKPYSGGPARLEHSYCGLIIGLTVSPTDAVGSMVYGTTELTEKTTTAAAHQFARDFSELLARWISSPKSRLSDVLARSDT
jgi:hypothetical protein